NVLKYTGSAYALAKSDTAANSAVVGIVSIVIDANNFVLLTEGYITGLSGLTAGSKYLLSSSVAGALTTVVGTVIKYLLIADTTTSGYFNIQFGPTFGTASGTFAQGNDNRFPASVTGIRLGGGVGSADVAAAIGDIEATIGSQSAN